jgi:hypothetical protein
MLQPSRVQDVLCVLSISELRLRCREARNVEDELIIYLWHYEMSGGVAPEEPDTSYDSAHL